jgi:hypothetical protein
MDISPFKAMKENIQSQTETSTARSTHTKQELFTHSKNASSRGSPGIASNLGHATKALHLNQGSLQVKSLPEKLMAAIKSRVNFWETFAPVASRSTIQFILTKALHIHKLISSTTRSTGRFRRDSTSKAKMPRICTGKA